METIKQMLEKIKDNLRWVWQDKIKPILVTGLHLSKNKRYVMVGAIVVIIVAIALLS
jgi:hypothetical protein